MSTLNKGSEFKSASERYAEVGVNVEAALAAAAALPLSLHCWQGDDVGGFERAGAALDRRCFSTAGSPCGSGGGGGGGRGPGISRREML